MAFSIKSFVRSFKNVDTLNDYFASVPVDIEIVEGLSEDERVEFVVQKFNDLSLRRQKEIISDLSGVDRCTDDNIAIQTLEDITKARNAKLSKLSESLNLANIEGKIHEIVEKIEVANKTVSAFNKALTKPYFDNKYRLFEIDVLNTVKMIDDTLNLLNPTKGLSSLLNKVKLKSFKEYFYNNKETISALSSLSHGYKPKTSYLLDLYNNPITYTLPQETKEDLILSKIDEMNKEIKALTEHHKEGAQEFRFDSKTNNLLVGGLKIPFNRAKNQVVILDVINSNLSKKRWELADIMELLNEDPFDKEKSNYWHKYLRQHVRSINDKVKRAGFHQEFLEYKDKALILHI